MKKVIENTLSALIGLELTKTTRIVNMECLKFGFKEELTKKGKLVNIGEYSIHIQSEWRIIKKDRMIIGSRDLYEPIEYKGWDEDFDYEKGNLRDLKIRTLIKEVNLLVEDVKADSFGGLQIHFSNDYELHIIPLNTSISEYNEYWRLLNNKEETENHFVIGKNEIDKLAN